MARLRPIKSVRVLTVEEKTRVANLFTLLIEVNLQTSAANKRRSPKKAKAKKAESQSFCEVGCCGFHRPIKHQPYSAKAMKGKPCHIKYPAMSNSSRTALRDLFFKAFTRILTCNIIDFIMGYCNDRYDRFTPYARLV